MLTSLPKGEHTRESWVGGGGECGDLPFSFGEVYLKVPEGLLCLDIQQVLGQRSLKGDEEFKDAVECPGSDCCSQRGFGPADIQFSSHLPWYLTSDLWPLLQVLGRLLFLLPKMWCFQGISPPKSSLLHPSKLSQNSYVRWRPMSATTFKRKEVVAAWTDCPRASTKGSWHSVPFVCVQDRCWEWTLWLFLVSLKSSRLETKRQNSDLSRCVSVYSTSIPSLNPAHTFLKVVNSPFMPAVSFSFHQKLNQAKVE